MEGNSFTFNVISVFTGVNNGVWIDPSDITTLFQDKAATIPVTASGQLVGCAKDKSGFNNHMLFEPGQEMKYTVVGNRKYLLGDDSNSNPWMVGHIGAPFSPAFNATWSRVSGFTPTGVVVGTIYGDAGTGSVNLGLGDPGDATMAMRNGTSGGPAVSYSGTGTDLVMTELWVAAGPCQLARDNGAYVSTPSMTGVAPKGVWVGMNNGGANHSTMKFDGMVMVNKAMLPSEVAGLRTYYGAKQGRLL